MSISRITGEKRSEVIWHDAILNPTMLCLCGDVLKFQQEIIDLYPDHK